jgi:hypothetical protein
MYARITVRNDSLSLQQQINIVVGDSAHLSASSRSSIGLNGRSLRQQYIQCAILHDIRSGATRAIKTELYYSSSLAHTKQSFSEHAHK